MVNLTTLWRPEKNICYGNPKYVLALINDASLLQKEIDGTSNLSEEEVRALWGRSHDIGFI